MLLTRRYYDAEVGGFVTRDPIGFGGGDWNTYGYVRGRVTGRTDALGLQDPVTIVVVVVIVILVTGCSAKKPAPNPPPDPAPVGFKCKKKAPSLPKGTPPLAKSLAVQHWCRECSVDCQIYCNDLQINGQDAPEPTVQSCLAACEAAEVACRIRLNFTF